MKNALTYKKQKTGSMRLARTFFVFVAGYSVSIEDVKGWSAWAKRLLNQVFIYWRPTNSPLE